MIDVPGGPVEVDVTPGDPNRPTLIFLHEGLGSIDLWRGFPDDVRDAAGGCRSIVFSRHGHGRSAPAMMPRPVGYMHHEADVVLPALLTALGVDRPVLIGHSDGASIALLFAGAGHEVTSLVCIAPHVFVEPTSIDGIAAARDQFEATDMKTKLGRYHDDPEATFRGWNDVWLSPDFRVWNIEDRLGVITAPTFVIQGADDEYGTIAQVEAIVAGVAGPCDQMIVSDAGHAPHLVVRELVALEIADHVTGRTGRAER